MTVDAIEPDRFDIARVIQQTFAVLGRNIVTFSILGVVLVAVPRAIVGYFSLGMMRGQIDAMSSGNFSLTPGYFQATLMGGLAALITSAILQGALIYATVQDLNGRPASVGDSLATGFRNFLPLIVVSILFGLAVFGGCLLLLVPGLMILCAWCVALPALIADRTGIFGAFSRSAELTRGNRWQIFGLFVILVVASAILGMIVNAITGVGSFGGNPAAAIERATSPISLVLNVVVATITAVVGSAAIAVIYVELRRAHEGEPTGWLAEVFR
jgi:hypothetical protein